MPPRTAINVYLVNKHYEVAPVLSMTEHEANNALLFVSDKLWQSLSAEQKQWVKTAAGGSQRQGAGQGVRAGKGRGRQAERIGVKIVEDVDKKSFADDRPIRYLDKLAKELGPHAEKIKNLIRAIN